MMKPGLILNFQLRIMAQDKGVPPLTSTCVVTVTVDHNLQSPAFQSQVYRAAVSECAPFGQSVLSVRATDGDKFVRFFYSSQYKSIFQN